MNCAQKNLADLNIGHSLITVHTPTVMNALKVKRGLKSAIDLFE